ncbi:MAG: S8 family serine peptidase [Bacillota bacterium]|nr:S8 family serine peptidase [Bacillota bacterium]
MTGIKKGLAWVLLAFFICSIVSFNPFTAQITNAKTQISESVFAALEKEPFVRVIVVLKDKADFEENPASSTESNVKEVISKLQETASSSEEKIWPVIQDQISRGNILDYQTFWIVNAFSASINIDALNALSALSEIIHIRSERQYNLSTPLNTPIEEDFEMAYQPSTHQNETGQYPWNLELIKAPLVWNKGIFGKGVVVAVMDTGVDQNHPALKNSYRGNLEGHSHETSWYDATSDDSRKTTPFDSNGHGTHVAGVILGGTPDEPIGVAPGASWIGVNIFSRGIAWDSHITQAFQWLLAPGGDPKNAPQIVNCSWASRPEYVTDYLQWEILHNLERAGIFVVFAAGNNGNSGPGSPASYPHAFSVGAVQKVGDSFKAADFSSKGPVKWQDVIYTKPEITAPGTNIRSAWLNNGYTVLDGTSLAAAHVSGASALLLESKPGLTPLEIIHTLTQTAYWDPSWNAGGKRPDNAYGFGVLDVYEAVNSHSFPTREIIFSDGAEEGIINWSTSPSNPWKITREKVHEGIFAFADSPWENYANNSHSWISLAAPLSLCGYHSPVLTIEHFFDLRTGKDKEDDYAYIEISTDGKNWAYLYRFFGTNEKYGPFSLPLNIPSGAENFYFRFRLKSNNNGPGMGWYIDNISISALPLSLEALERMVLSTDRTIIGTGDSLAIKANAIFCTKLSREIDAEFLEWSSSDSSVATIQDGNVQGISPGSTVIRGKFRGHTAEVKIEVIEIGFPAVQPDPGVYINTVSLQFLQTIPGSKIYFTLDGSEPNEQSHLYENTFVLDETKTVKARLYFSGIPGPVQTFNYTITEGSVVSGSLNIQGRSLPDHKTSVSFICNKEGHIFHVPNFSPEGKFSIELPLGTYRLVATRQQYLTKELKVNLQTKEGLQNVDLKLWAGDLNNDNRIDITDLTLLSLAYRTRPGDDHWNPLADLNGDAIVDIFDLTMLTQNYGMAGGS